MHRSLFTRFMLLACVLGGILGIVSVAQARIMVTSGLSLDSRWKQGPWVHFKFDPNFERQIVNEAGTSSVPGAMAAVRTAATEWNNSTGFEFREVPSTDSRGGWISGKDGKTYSCRTESAGAACSTYYTATDGWRYFSTVEMIFNNNPALNYRFHADPNQCSVKIGKVNGQDYQINSVCAIARHEFGHWAGLADEYWYREDPILPAEPNSTMNDHNKPVYESDKRGVTLWYGPYTGFDYWRASGITYPNNDFATYKPGLRDTTNYYNTTGSVPELSPVFASTETSYNNVQPAFGDRMERFAGTSRSTFSYAYYPIFDRVEDRFGHARNVIVPGAKLKWHQYNYQQTSFSVDAEFLDGTNLRDDLRIVDQNGVQIHPKRHRYPTGTWHYFEVDLTPVAGKEVKRWLIAYDNQDTQWVGQFRAYFDSLKLTWPGAKQ